MASQNAAPRLDAECSYVLECAVELGEITPLEEAVYRGNTPAAHEFATRSYRNEGLPPHWLKNTARHYLDSCSEADRYVWALIGLRGLEFCLKTFTERIEFAVKTKVQVDLGLDNRTGIAWMDESDGMFCSTLFPTVHDITYEKVQQFASMHYGAAREALLTDLSLTQAAIQWAQVAEHRQYAQQRMALWFMATPPAESPVAPTVRGLTANLVRERQQRKQARSAIKKVVKLFSRLGKGADQNVRLLVAGKAAELSHPDSPFKFELTPLAKGWLEAKTVAPGGHVPFQLSVLTKEGVFLSRLCVLFDSTPVLDQLLALTLFIQAGDELELLEKANWFGYEDAVKAREVLSQVAPSLLSKIPAPNSHLTGKGVAKVHDHFFQMDRHWQPYKAPVSNWLTDWMAPVTSLLNNLRGTTPEAVLLS